jgi:hypothetical protein
MNGYRESADAGAILQLHHVLRSLCYQCCESRLLTHADISRARNHTQQAGVCLCVCVATNTKATDREDKHSYLTC